MSSTCWAIDGKRAVSQYLVNRWDSEQGMTGESVDAIAQTPDQIALLNLVKAQ